MPGVRFEGVSKVFQVPTERRTRLKDHVINLFRSPGRRRFEALKDIDFTVGRGEFFSIIGHNGSGKSTLMKILAGMYQRDGGRMLWQGRETDLKTPAEAAAIGIAMVHQESLLAPHLSVAENIFLGREPRRPFGWVDRAGMAARARRLIADHRFPLQAEWRVEKLSPAAKQLVEICRAIQHGSSLLIFDEPTSSLSEGETQEVFRIVRTLRERKMGVIYITHRLEELRAVGDRVTILRDGRTVCSSALCDMSTDAIIHNMVGREVSAIYRRDPIPPGAELLRVDSEEWSAQLPQLHEHYAKFDNLPDELHAQLKALEQRLA